MQDSIVDEPEEELQVQTKENRAVQALASTGESNPFQQTSERSQGNQLPAFSQVFFLSNSKNSWQPLVMSNDKAGLQTLPTT